MDDMNRRRFLSLLGVTVAASAVGEKLLCAFPPLTNSKGKFGNFDIEADGTLSLDGQTRWPLYGADGGLSFKTVSYKLHHGNVVETIES